MNILRAEVILHSASAVFPTGPTLRWQFVLPHSLGFRSLALSQGVKHDCHVNAENRRVFEYPVQIGAVAQWLDITHSDLRTSTSSLGKQHPQYFPECLPELIPALPQLDALPCRSLVRRRPRETGRWAYTSQ